MAEEFNRTTSGSSKNQIISFLSKGYNKLIAAGIIALIVVIGISGCNLFKGKVAATVNGENIYLSQVDSQYDIYVKQLKTNKQPAPGKDQEKNMKSMILENLIRVEIIRQLAEKEGVKVSDKEVEKGVQQIKSSMSKEQFTKSLKQMGWDEEELAVHVKDQIVETKLREKKAKGSDVSEKDAAGYYQQNKVNYKVPEQINVAIARVTKKADADKIAEEGKTNFAEAGQKYAKMGYQAAMKQGKDQLKFNYSEEFANAVFDLTKGDMTGVIKVNGGYAVAKAEGSREAGYQKTFKEVKQEVIAMLKSQKEQESFEKLIAEFKSKAEVKIMIDDLKPQTQPQTLPSGHPNTGK